jgi:hypothetical protein
MTCELILIISITKHREREKTGANYHTLYGQITALEEIGI